MSVWVNVLACECGVFLTPACIFLPSQAIHLVSELCLYYGLGDSKLWTKTLYQLLHLSMVIITFKHD